MSLGSVDIVAVPRISHRPVLRTPFAIHERLVGYAATTADLSQTWRASWAPATSTWVPVASDSRGERRVRKTLIDPFAKEPSPPLVRAH
jgi:hypothetical protein